MNKVYTYDNARIITAGAMVNADGHSQAYHPDGTPPGLDYIENAGYPGNWWGIATDSDGDPYIQTKDKGHPDPGFYVSTTALIDSAYAESHPYRYVHSGEIPSFVIPSSPKFDIALKDVAYIHNKSNGKSVCAVCADIGPTDEFGEVSIFAAKKLGLNADPKSGGTHENEIVYVMFIDAPIKWPSTPHEIHTHTMKVFREWGGTERLEANDLI
jgi:hypothetical protein